MNIYLNGHSNYFHNLHTHCPLLTFLLKNFRMSMAMMQSFTTLSMRQKMHYSSAMHFLKCISQTFSIHSVTFSNVTNAPYLLVPPPTKCFHIFSEHKFVYKSKKNINGFLTGIAFPRDMFGGGNRATFGLWGGHGPKCPPGSASDQLCVYKVSAVMIFYLLHEKRISKFQLYTYYDH